MAASVDQKLLRQTKFPPEFNQKVDMQKINVEVMKKWIAGKITEILKSDDDIVIELCFGLLEGSRFPDIKSLQISLTGFLDKDAPKFCRELWNLCLSAQSSPRGVAKELLEAKKQELLQEKVDSEKAMEEARQQKDREATRERDVDGIRQRERAEHHPPLEGDRADEKLTVTSHAAVAEAGLMVEADLPLDLCPAHARPLAGDGAAGHLGRGLDQPLPGAREERERSRGALQRVRALDRADDGPDESRPKRDARRLSRSPDGVHDRRRRRPSRSGSRSGSGTPSKREKRRRSLQRYDPAARYRRNTSSVSSPEQKRRKRNDDSVEASPRTAPRRIPSATLLQLSSYRHLAAGRGLPSHTHALAILLPRRGYATETSTQAGGSGPPPGFNIEEAKKPLPKDEAKAASPSAAAESSKSDEQLQGLKAAPEDATLTNLAAEKAAKTAAIEAKEHELDHYWQGTKLLAAEIRISMKLALKMAAGYELSRREHRQLQRTVQDLGRLVPFSVFVIVPFAELLLPVALKLFPNLLPSTYESQSSREAKATRLRETRKGVSTFLRNTLRETSFPVSSKSAKKEEFQEFFRKVRATGETPTREDVIKVCKIFKDDLTLDNLSRPQLVGMCKYMNLNSFGTDAWLRYQIRHRMRQIKRDDKAISFEGVDSLSVPELQMACAARGIRTYGMSPAGLREDLQLWLDLRLKYNIPSTLLVLSNAFMYTSGKDSEINSQIDALQAVLSAIPEELFHEMELEVHNAEGAATNKLRLEVLKEQQELIEEENKQAAASSKNEDGVAVGDDVKDDKDIDEKPAPKADRETDTGKDAAVAREAAQAEHDAEEAVAAAPVKKD
ncbi:hypothetical protein DV737_g87, partial [Chaetothyriales sp. CBS 132003]